MCYDATITHRWYHMKRVSVRFADKEHEDLVFLSKQTERSINELV